MNLGGQAGGFIGYKVYQYTLKGKFIKEYLNANLVENISSSSIRAVIKNKRYQAGGFIWVSDKKDILQKVLDYNYSKTKWDKNLINNQKFNSTKLRKSIKGINVHSKKELIFKSITEAAKYFNVTKSAICAVTKGRAKTCKEYTWEYIT